MRNIKWHVISLTAATADRWKEINTWYIKNEQWKLLIKRAGLMQHEIWNTIVVQLSSGVNKNLEAWRKATQKLQPQGETNNSSHAAVLHRGRESNPAQPPKIWRQIKPLNFTKPFHFTSATKAPTNQNYRITEGEISFMHKYDHLYKVEKWNTRYNCFENQSNFKKMHEAIYLT